jgi:caffeoyl-CoA O-methyltransferase
MEMTDQRWRYTSEYSREVFGWQDGHLAGLMAEATAAGLPDIAVSPDVGRLLMILTAMTRGRLALEVGTLGGYSGIWIARGLAEGGRLITIEREPGHAAFAQEQFERAGVSDRVELRIGAALEVLPRLAGELGPGSVDVVFIDAEKTEYTDYWLAVRPLVAVGGLVMADNVLGTGSSWIDQQDQPQPRAVDRFNRLVAGDDAFEAVAAPLRQGVLIARRFEI